MLSFRFIGLLSQFCHLLFALLQGRSQLGDLLAELSRDRSFLLFHFLEQTVLELLVRGSARYLELLVLGLGRSYKLLKRSFLRLARLKQRLDRLHKHVLHNSLQFDLQLVGGISDDLIEVLLRLANLDNSAFKALWPRHKRQDRLLQLARELDEHGQEVVRLHLLLCLLLLLLPDLVSGFVLLLDDLVQPLERVLMLHCLLLELVLEALLLWLDLLVNDRLHVLPFVQQLFLQLDNLQVLMPDGTLVAALEQRVPDSGYFDAGEDFRHFTSVDFLLLEPHVVQFPLDRHVFVNLLGKILLGLLQVYLDSLVLHGQRLQVFPGLLEL